MGSNPAWDATALLTLLAQTIEPKKGRCLDDFGSNRPIHGSSPALTYGHGESTVVTLQDGLAYYKTYARAENKSPKTIRWIMSSVSYFGEFLGPGTQDVSVITASDMRRFMVALRDRPKFSQHPFNRPMAATLSPQSVETYCRAIRAYFGFLEREGFITANPMTRVKMPKVPNLIVPTLSEKEAVRLLGQPDKTSPVGFRDYSLMLTLIDTGIRLTELTNLKIGDIDYEQNFFKVLGKGGKERLVPFGKRVAKALMKYSIQFRPESSDGDYFWLARDGHHLAAQRIEKIIRDYGKQAGLKRCYPHMLRHTSAVKFLRNGGDVFSLCKSSAKMRHKIGH